MGTGRRLAWHSIALLTLMATLLSAPGSDFAAEVLDQQSIFPSAIGDSVADYSEIGQTFTVGITGKLTRVEVYSAKFPGAAGNAVLTVYNTSGGLPNQALGSASIGSDAFSANAPTFVSFDVSSFQIPVHQNDLMAFAVSLASGFGAQFVLPYNDQNPYAAGRAVLRYSGGSWQVQNESRDRSFKTYVDVVAAPLLGDYNGNSVLDAADYTVWRDTLATGGTTLLNDPTPALVDSSDFTYWRDHFGAAGSGAGVQTKAAVPEPVTGILFAAALPFLRSLVRRHRIARA